MLNSDCLVVILGFSGHAYENVCYNREKHWTSERLDVSSFEVKMGE